MPKRGFNPYIHVHTRASTSSGDRRFFPDGRPMDATRIKKVRPGLEIYNSNGDVIAWPAYQIADDGESFPAGGTFTIIGSLSRNSDGTSYDTGWNDISAGLTAGLVRFGWVVRNDTVGTAIVHALISGRWEFQQN